MKDLQTTIIEDIRDKVTRELTDDVPLSQSSVSFKLVDIQQRCRELLGEAGEPGELRLEESSNDSCLNDPYRSA